MFIRTYLFHIIIVAVILFIGPCKNSVHDLPCEDDTKCKTGSCDSAGSCICNLPDPSTILDGDRSFLGGRFCDEEMTMCDGTSSFWCENGGKCVEIVQGENYTCKCPPGFIGDHCEHPGTACGRGHCFHGAKCLVQDQTCECSSDWKGSADCSLPSPTITQTGSSVNITAARIPQPREIFSSSSNWMVVALAISFSAGAVAGGAVYAKKLFGKKQGAAPKFQQLSQMQSHDILDDDDDDEEEDGTMVHNNSHSHL